MIGEIFDRVLTYGTPAFLFVKEILKKTAGHTELQTEAMKKIVEITKGGRTRADELVFIASLISLTDPDATLENKQLFLQKHYELLCPDFTGKDPAEVAKLQQKEKMAKGLIFLIAEDKTICNPACVQEDLFRLANKVWCGIFLGVKDLPDENAKLQVLEKRILHFGKNNQERMSLAEVVGKINPIWDKIDSTGDKLGDEIFSLAKWIDCKCDQKLARGFERNRLRKANWINWLNPYLWIQQFMDLR